MRTVEVFADVACPFAYVGLQRFVAQRDARGADVRLRVRAWPLEWLRGTPLDPTEVARQVSALRRSVAPELFGGFDASCFPRTSIPAFGLVAAAYRLDAVAGEAMSVAVREAIFESGEDVADPAVLEAIGWRFGVEPMAPARAAEAVLHDWERGRELGVRGSPHFFADGGSWFCPSLAITQHDTGYEVQVDERKLQSFYRAALDPSRRDEPQTAIR
jgi:predicted DsbA family dithiol-disulfide isomerase